MNPSLVIKVIGHVLGVVIVQDRLQDVF
jgi:hypothetical protein